VRRFVLYLFVCILTAPAWAVDDADNDPTPVPICSDMPASGAIAAISVDDAKRICRAMNLLPGVRLKDIRTFSKAAVVLAHEGYEGTIESTTKQLVEIVRLRGLNNQPDRWYSNLNVIVKVYQAFNGVVTPMDAIAFLDSAGPSAKKLSDEGFSNMLIYIVVSRQSGD